MSEIMWYAVCDADNVCVSIGSVVAPAEELAEHGLHIGDQRAFGEDAYPVWDADIEQLVEPPEPELEADS
jgi:hypothetical protein